MFANAIGIQLSDASLRYKDSQTPTLAGLSMTIPANQW
ncbi:ABC transporter ATP-binding protein, partial [Vibrio alginolyticus]